MTKKPINPRSRGRPPKPMPRIEASPERAARDLLCGKSVRPVNQGNEDRHSQAKNQ